MRKGFTLFDLLTTMAVIGILFGMAMPMISKTAMYNLSTELKATTYSSVELLDKIVQKEDPDTVDTELTTNGWKDFNDIYSLEIDDTTYNFVSTIKKSEINIQPNCCNYNYVLDQCKEAGYILKIRNNTLNKQMNYNSCNDSLPYLTEI